LFFSTLTPAVFDNPVSKNASSLTGPINYKSNNY
jgi:hypothetical protein